MRKITLVGCSGAGKTTLTQAMKGRKITYHKMQYTNNYDVVIDTLGKYAKNKTLARTLILYSYKADTVGLLMNVIEGYSLHSPNIVPMAVRGVIGIVTQVNQPEARPDLATVWLEFTGCKRIFYVNSTIGEGVGDTLDYLWGEGNTMPQEREGEADEVSSDADGQLYGKL